VRESVNDTPAKSTAELIDIRKLLRALVSACGGLACRVVLERADASLDSVLL
jgi:hypothetical protein